MFCSKIVWSSKNNIHWHKVPTVVVMHDNHALKPEQQKAWSSVKCLKTIKRVSVNFEIPLDSIAIVQVFTTFFFGFWEKIWEQDWMNWLWLSLWGLVTNFIYSKTLFTLLESSHCVRNLSKFRWIFSILTLDVERNSKFSILFRSFLDPDIISCCLISGTILLTVISISILKSMIFLLLYIRSVCSDKTSSIIGLSLALSIPTMINKTHTATSFAEVETI